MRNLCPSKGLLQLVLVIIVAWSSSNQVAAQSHPRMLFTAQEVPAIQARIAVPGSQASWAYSQLATSCVRTGSNAPSVHWVTYRALQDLQEVALRYALTGNTSYGNNAKTVLLQWCAFLNPTGTRSYAFGSYSCALALTFDLIHPLLSASEKATVANHLEAWVTRYRTDSHGWASWGNYGAAVDNHAMGWSTGIAFSLMAIEGDSNYPNLSAFVAQNLQRIKDGWSDLVSPDGSIDESYGYANYGTLYAINAGVAGINCGYGDYFAGSNILKTPNWYGASFGANEWLFVGDCNQNHRGLRVDPSLWYAVQRTQNAEHKWGLDRVYAAQPVNADASTFAFSPYISVLLWYPDSLSGQQPKVLSSFFRDNLNEGSPNGNKVNAFTGIGLGGHAFMHSEPTASQTPLLGYYNIRDEWMNHAHEDDGNFGLAIQGVWMYKDRGYGAQNSSWPGAQSVDHNIANAVGSSGFGGGGNNYYNPPNPNGRFLGEKKALLMSSTADYLHGDHSNMWQMNEADRYVVMVKDSNDPYVILIDQLNRNETPQTYEEIFTSAGPAAGNGTVSSPMTVSSSGRTLRATWLSPSSVQVIAGGNQSSGPIYFNRNLVRASGTQVTFVSVHGSNGVQAAQPLVSPQAGTKGGTIQRLGGVSDRILVTEGTSLGDSQTSGNAKFGWVRLDSSGQVMGWIIGEGTTLNHAGQNLITASQDVVASARNGEVDIATVSGSASSGFGVTFFAPFAVLNVTVDGVPALFTQSGSIVSVGSAPTPPTGPPPTATLPPATNDDRVYTFRNGFMNSGLTWGPITTTSEGRMSSANGWSGIVLKEGQLVGGRPLAVGVSVMFRPGSNGVEAALEFQTTPGTQDVFAVLFERFSSGLMTARLRQNGATIATYNLPFDQTGIEARAVVEYNPVSGSFRLTDGWGITRGLATLAPAAQMFTVTAATTSYAELDNVTLFDSAEDGQTPQGIAVYREPDGRGGFFMRTPNIIGVTGILPTVHRSPLEPMAAGNWFASAQMNEILATRFLDPMSQVPSYFAEAGFELNRTGVVPSSPGQEVGIAAMSPSGQLLQGTYIP